jgi:hypothetical protein
MGRRSCCIVGCHNSGEQLYKWRECLCEIHGTKRIFCDCLEPFRLIPFPSASKQPDLRQQWIKIVNRRQQDKKEKIWQPNEDSRVCSEHFEPNGVIPILKLGYDVKTLKRRKPPTVRSEIVKKRQRQSSTESLPESCSLAVPEENDEHVDVVQNLNSEVNISLTKDHDYPNENRDTDFSNSTNNIQRIAYLEQMIEAYKSELQMQSKFGYHKITTDKKMKFYTGISTIEGFDALFASFKNKIPYVKLWRGASSIKPRKHHFFLTPVKIGRERKLLAIDQMLLTLMKLRLGLLTVDLAERFGISISTCSRIFTTWIKFLSNELRCLIFNPTKEVCRKNLPKAFKNSRNKEYRDT